MTGPFYLPSNTEPAMRVRNVVAQQQRSGNEDALTHAIDLITSDCRARASEWRRAGDVERAEAFMRVAAAVKEVT